MDAVYFRVSSERQTTENQFEDLIRIAERDGSGRDWGQIQQALARSVYEERRTTETGASRTVYRVRGEVAAELAEQCIYVEQGKCWPERTVCNCVILFDEQHFDDPQRDPRLSDEILKSVRQKLG